MSHTLKQKIENNPVYKQILSDSIGGLLYDVKNQGTYDTSELLPMMEEVGRDAMDGIMGGAFTFIKES